MRGEIREAAHAGDTVGGVFELVATGVPPGLGTHAMWDRKLDGRIAGALMSIQGIKGVEIGLAFEGARRRGSTSTIRFSTTPPSARSRAPPTPRAASRAALPTACPSARAPR